MRKSSKKAALAVAAMMVGSIFCTPVFAQNIGDQWYNGVAIGEVGTFTDGRGPSWGAFNGYNTIEVGNGALVDYRATNFYAEGHVGIFGNTGDNLIKEGVGAYIGWTDNAKAVGTVGYFNGSRRNTIETAAGAVVGGGSWRIEGSGNSATGRVGVFTDSFNNKITNAWVQNEDNEWVEISSVGAYVENGTRNTAIGDVGIFTNAGSNGPWDQAGDPYRQSTGNKVEASYGAIILNGTDNKATGTVGSFSGDRQGDISNLTSNIVKPSTGAYIASGANNTAVGNVGFFNTNGMGFTPIANTAPTMSGNVVQGTGAAIMAGSNNYAYGMVGSFTGAPGVWYMTNNQVNGNGAVIQGGSNNYANGTVGVFNGGWNTNNKVNGTGVVIFKK